MQSLDDAQILEIERHAVDIARGAGRILAGHFGRRIEVEFKDDKQRDPVTAADKQTQAYLAAEILRRFPGHGILGEEATEEEKQSEEPARDTLWVLDPLDGTTNFLNGLPVFASSIGVIHRGRPVAAALYIPWPADGGGFVLHCRRGGGAMISPLTPEGEEPGEPVKVLETEQPIPNRLIGLPGYFGVANRFTGGLAGKEGELRTTGSIAYELAMVGRGVMQYGIFGAPRMWDMAAGRPGGAGGRRHGDDTVQGRTAVASHRQLRADLGGENADNEGTACLGGPAGRWQPASGAADRQQRPPPLQPARQAAARRPCAAGQETAITKITVAAHVSTGICFPGRGHIALSGT